MTTNNKKFLLLGIPPGGVFLARQLRMAFPDAIIYAIGDLKRDIGRYSESVNRFYGYSVVDELSPLIQRAYDDLGGGYVEAFMCSNPVLEYVLGQCPEVFYFLHFENGIDIYQRLVNKASFDKLCMALNLSKPELFELSHGNFDIIDYPVVVKPLEKGLALGASKCAFISDEKHLAAYLDKMERLGINRNHLVCQKFVAGDNRWEYGFGGYFRNGEPLVDILFYQFRQMPQGLCCYTREIVNYELVSKIKRFVTPVLIAMRYNGFIEFDLKQDADTGQLFLLDINPRPWRSVDMLSAKLGKSTVFSPSIQSCQVVWRYPYRELLSLSNKRNVPYRICKKVADNHHVSTCLSLYDRKDNKPYHKQLRADIKELIRLLYRKHGKNE